MATPTLTGLPTELLIEIIPHVLPEGFESLALTCRTIYKLCTPFIKRHNHLRSQFQKFRYREHSRDPLLSPIRTAFDLITRIAIEPIVARYIRDADLSRDSLPPRARLRLPIPDVQCGGPVVTMHADSPYLRQAGLDWKEYYTLMKEDLEQRQPAYSQHAAAFILTLLPNAKTLKLPRYWKSLDRPDKLLDFIVRGTKKSNFPWDTPSLAQVTRFESLISWDDGSRFESIISLEDGNRYGLVKEIPFLALPHVRAFCGHGSVAMGDASMALASTDPYPRYGETLEIVHLVGCCMDEVAIANFLKQTPHLRTLIYSHSTRVDGDWNICKFVTAVEREVGSHLEEFSITLRDLRGSITPGKASMRGFQRLRKLEFPLEIAMCNVTDAMCQLATLYESRVSDSVDHDLDNYESLIDDLVPASVSQLSLKSDGADHHEKALDHMFHDFAAKKNSQFPALKEIQLSCPTNADRLYKDQCARLLVEIEKVGVILCLKSWSYSLI